ncbi:hypothetical protein IT575_05510 [bacterium]|nr:hypothetical protein [bacterium]
MFKRIILSVVACVAILVSIASAASQNAVETWNQLAGQYNFDSYPAAATDTFESAYNGNNFEADFAGIMGSMENLLAVKLDDLIGDDRINISLEDLL